MLGAVLAIMLAQAQTASVADALPLREGSFRESFEPVRLSTPVLAAANLGAPLPGTLAGSGFLVPALNPGSDNFFCVLVTTRDGLFWARNPFIGSADARFWRIITITERYERQIGAYRSDDLLIVASIQDRENCEGASNVFIPVVFDEAGPLHLQINSRGRRSTAVLSVDGEVISTAECGRAANPVLVVDRYCTLELPDILPDGDVQLALEFDDFPFGREVWVTGMRLPARDGR